MICFFFGLDMMFIALLAATDNVIGYVKYLDFDALDIIRAQMVRFAQFENTLQGRLRMELSVVLLDIRTRDDLKILALPVNLKMSGYSVHEAFVAFEDLQRAANATHGKK